MTAIEILSFKDIIQQKAREADLLGKRLDVSPLMFELQIENYANIARIRELLEKKFGETPLYGIELRGEVVTSEWEDQSNQEAGQDRKVVLG